MSKLLSLCLALSVVSFLPIMADARSASKTETLTIFVKSAPPSMSIVREEVARLMKPTGFEVAWKDMSENRLGEDFAHLATVDFKGGCDAGASAPPISRLEVGSLASTAVADGLVLPFSTIQCDALRKVLGSALSTTDREKRQMIFGRAAARVLAHELFHMLAQTKGHGTRGVSKSCFGFADLTSPDFAFDEDTVAQMKPLERAVAVEEAWDFSGR